MQANRLGFVYEEKTDEYRGKIPTAGLSVLPYRDRRAVQKKRKASIAGSLTGRSKAPVV